MDSVIFEGSLLQQYLDDEGIDHECTPSLSAGLEQDFQDFDPEELDAEKPDSGVGSENGAAVSVDAESQEPSTKAQHALAHQHDEIVRLLAVSKSFLSTLAEEFLPLNSAKAQDDATSASTARSDSKHDSEKPGLEQLKLEATTLKASSELTSIVPVASELIQGMVRLHRQLNRIHRKVRDAELVSRGYRLALPLPPIQRIERNQSTRVEDLQCLPLRYKMVQVCHFGQELIETSVAAVGSCFGVVNGSRAKEGQQSPHSPKQKVSENNPLESVTQSELTDSIQDNDTPPAPKQGEELGNLSLRGLRKGNKTLTTAWKEFWAVLLLCFRGFCAQAHRVSLTVIMQRMASLHDELVGHASGLQMLVGALADTLRGHTFAEQLRQKQEEDLASQAWNDKRIGGVLHCLSELRTEAEMAGARLLALHQRAIGMARSGGNQESEDSPNDSVSNDSTPSQADSPNGAELLSDPRTFYSRSDWTAVLHDLDATSEFFERSVAEQQRSLALARAQLRQIIENEPTTSTPSSALPPPRLDDAVPRGNNHGIFAGGDDEAGGFDKDTHARNNDANEAITHVFQVFTGRRPASRDCNGSSGSESEDGSSSDSGDDFRAKFKPPAFLLQELGARLTALPGRREMTQPVPEEVFGASSSDSDDEDPAILAADRNNRRVLVSELHSVLQIQAARVREVETTPERIDGLKVPPPQ